MRRSVLRVVFDKRYSPQGDVIVNEFIVGVPHYFSDGEEKMCVSITIDRDTSDFIAAFSDGYTVEKLGDLVFEEKP